MRDPALGFMSLDKRLVEALICAGVDWCRVLGKAKDIMHFGLYRGGTIKKSAPAAL